jgi:Family of unknown function (DUF6275)
MSTWNDESFTEKARRLVFESDDTIELSLESVKVVWFCKTLQNWKALVAVLVPEGKFYEVTYNGDKQETYLDAYAKVSNELIKDK